MFKSTQFVLLLCMICFLSSCSFVRQTGELKRFVNSSFAVSSVEIQEINHINLSGVNKAADLSWVDLMAIGQQILSGNLPAKMKIDVYVKNNSDKLAAVAGMDFKVLLKEELITEGSITESIQVEPGASSIFPVLVDINLVTLLGSSSLDQLLDLAFGNNQQEVLDQIGAKIQIKPYYLSGSDVKKYPGYINIRL